MGMDVYGVDPTTEDGAYFRRNVWGWRPLWTLVECIAEDVEFEAIADVSGHFNDGDGLGAIDAVRLGTILNESVENGKAQIWIDLFNKEKEEAPLEDCTICDATGIRTDQIGIESGWHEKALTPEIAEVVGREFGSCNGCEGRGKKEAFMTWYGVDLDDVKEFANFVTHSGGFEIC